MYHRQERPISLVRFALYSMLCWTSALLLVVITSEWTSRMLTLCLSSIILFLFPLLLLGRGRALWGHINCLQWQHFLRENTGYRLPLYLLPILLSLIVLPTSYALSELSYLIISHLPTSWGIDITDHIQKEASEILKASGLLNRGCQLFTFAILPAFVEELYFRGELQPLCQQKLGRHQGIWFVSIIFSLLHLSTLGFASRLFVGLCLGYSYDRTKSLPVAICLHMLNNAISLALLLI